MVALYRPGPMELIPSYIRRKHKKEKIEYLHPKLEPILKNTYGIPVYQEQIMQIAQNLASFSLAEADLLRKAIGKKIKKLLLSQKEKFIEGSKKNQVSEEVAKKIWNWIEPFCRYSFNRSHAASYAIIAYQTAYLKAHFPVEFMAALLTSEKNDVERIGFLIEECKKMQIEVLPPDINESFRNFTVIPGKKQIRFGLLAIKNVGENVVNAIIQERKNRGPYLSIQDFISRIETKDLNKKSLESLIKAGVFDKIEERNKLLFNLEDLLELNREIKRIALERQGSLFGKGAFGSINLKETRPANENEKLNWEKELLGLYVSSHPLKNFQKILQTKALPVGKINQQLSGKLVKIGGIISSIKKVITKVGKPMLFLKIEDLTDKIEVVAFPGVIEKNPTAFQENKIVFVSGRVDMKDGVPKLICEQIEEIIEK
jgi:DNA polymerase-3 subunit alpha